MRRRLIGGTSRVERGAWAEAGTVERLEEPAASFVVGILWHPEEGEDRALFEALVDAAGGKR